CRSGTNGGEWHQVARGRRSSGTASAGWKRVHVAKAWDEPDYWPWPTGERWPGRFENRDGDELRRRQSGREPADEPREVCARAIQRPEANREHDHHPNGREPRGVADFWQRPAGNRHKARRTECGPSSVFERRQRRAAHY